jgi:hypothetical protein
MIERLDAQQSYHNAELMDGDIVIVERDLSEEE